MSFRPQLNDQDPTVAVGADAPTGRPALVVADGDNLRTGEVTRDPDDEVGDGVPSPLAARKPWLPPDFSGRVLDDRYRIIEMLGFGGMATVYEAEHITIQKRVAVKILNPDYAGDREIAGRFLQEARTASKLRHEHIIDITDFGDTEGTVYFVMELLEGEDLSTTLLENGPLHYPRVIGFAKQICTALLAAHKIGVIHRDIKPANCFRVTRSGNSDFIKVLDFGIAKVASGERDAQTTGTPLGTPGYMALELLKGESYDHRVDIYALGVLMYKLLTNKMPFPALNAYGTLARQLDGKPIPLRKAAPDRGIPERLEGLILRAIARDPDDRFQSAEALLDALTDAEESLPLGKRLPRDPRDWGGAEAASSSAENSLTGSGSLQSAASLTESTSLLASRSPVVVEPAPEKPRSRWPIAVIAALLSLFAVLTLPDLISRAEPELITKELERARSFSRSLSDHRREPVPPPAPTPAEETPKTAPPEPEPTPEPEIAPKKPAIAAEKPLPRTLPETTVHRRLDRLSEAMKGCRKRFSGGLSNEHTLEISLSIDASTGQVKEVKDLNGGALAPIGSCAIRAVKQTIFPLAQDDTTVTHTFTY